MFALTAEGKITSLLTNWYSAIRFQHLLKAEQLKKEVDMLIKNLEEDQTIGAYYSLLNFRHKLLANNTDGLEESLQQLEPMKKSSDKLLNYYYYFSKAIYLTKIGSYDAAKEYFEKAHELLVYVHDDVEKAEFHYRIAVFCYHTCKLTDAMNYAAKGREVFLSKDGYEINVASCENILGLVSLELQQFEMAEEYFVSAIGIMKKNNQDQLVQKIKHNLGLMYADQALPHVAIRYLEESKIENYRTMYLLAREYYKLDMKEKAVDYINKGIDFCRVQPNEEYTHHLTILRAKIESVGIESLEPVIRLGIEYFKKEGLLHYVVEYAEEMAMRFCNEGADQKVSEYFRIAYEAKQELKKRGALK